MSCVLPCSCFSTCDSSLSLSPPTNSPHRMRPAPRPFKTIKPPQMFLPDPPNYRRFTRGTNPTAALPTHTVIVKHKLFQPRPLPLPLLYPTPRTCATMKMCANPAALTIKRINPAAFGPISREQIHQPFEAGSCYFRSRVAAAAEAWPACVQWEELWVDKSIMTT